MACILLNNELTISGDVGDFDGADHFTAGDVLLALASIQDAARLTVRINSGGGYATEGAAIHAILSRRVGTTDVVVEGIAASAASLIAMAGETVSMSAGAVMMIHDPAAWTMGDAAAHQKSIEELEALATAYARIYAAKSGKTLAQARAIMRATTWFTPEEAVAEGFADKQVTNAARPVAAFNYRAYANAPDRLVAMAQSKGWTRPHSASSRRGVEQKETTMTKPTKTNLDILRESTMSRDLNGWRRKPQEIEELKEKDAKMAGRSALRAAVDETNKRRR